MRRGVKGGRIGSAILPEYIGDLATERNSALTARFDWTSYAKEACVGHSRKARTLLIVILPRRL